MKNNSIVARPYARAAFEFAKEKGTLNEWHDQLALLSEAVQYSDVQSVLTDPRLTIAQQVEILDAVTKGKISTQIKQFLYLLAESGRLKNIDEIYSLFDQYKAEHERVIDVRLTTAAPIDDAMQKRFVDALTKRLGRKVDLVCDMDPAIMGGAVVRAGDQVIDGSVKGRLERLAETLSA
jgi:F-type H+-transporting ATPase subunit delta